MGSKARFTNELIPILEYYRKPGQTWVEPFMGGCNMLSEARGARIGRDRSKLLVALWRAIVDGWVPPVEVSKEEYVAVRANPEKYDPWYAGWVGYNCSYSGVAWHGYAGKTLTKDGTIRDYQLEAWRNMENQIPKLKGVQFEVGEYQDFDSEEPVFLYCDPPYAGTSGYVIDTKRFTFDSDAFWNWCRLQREKGHAVLISEYSAPEDFVCIWEMQTVSSLSANGVSGGAKESYERLFIHKDDCKSDVFDAPRKIEQLKLFGF